VSSPSVESVDSDVDLARGAPGSTFRVRYALDPPERIGRLRPLVHWLLVLPHLVVVTVLQLVSQVLLVVSWFVILLTGRLPTRVAGFQVMYVRYRLRMATYAGFLRPEYPPFTFTGALTDPGDDPRLRVDAEPQIEGRSRVSAFFRLILALPHILVLFPLAFVLLATTLVAAVAVIVTGRWPTPLRDFTLGVGRWWLRAESYLLLLFDEYPPFTTADRPLPGERASPLG
jgi:Domain of unknown function (DUF4389)